MERKIEDDQLAKQYLLDSMFIKMNREFEKLFGNKNGKGKKYWNKYQQFKEEIISDYMQK